MDSISQIRTSFKGICDKLAHEWPIFTAPRHDGSPHIEALGDELSYVVTDRGAEIDRRRTKVQADVLYWLASDMVF